MSTVHVLYKGRTEDLEFEQVFPVGRFQAIGIPEGTTVSASNLTEGQIKAALSQHFDVGLGEFEDHYVEINPNGNVTVRPNTTYGVS